MKTLSFLSVLALYGGVAGAQQAPAPHDSYQQPGENQSDDEYDQTPAPGSMQPVDPYDNQNPQAETGDSRRDSLDPDQFRYTIKSREIAL